MTGDNTAPAGAQQAELGVLLAGAVRAVASAQDVLDDHARQRAEAYQKAAPGSLTLPPLWYAFDVVTVDIELSSEVVRTTSSNDAPGETQLLCRTLNPLTVGLYGYSASTGTRVHVGLSPQRFVPATLPPQEGESPSPR
jgi:hypothetical protein